MLKNNSVELAGLKPELLIGVMVADKVYSEYGLDFVITSCVDGKHSSTSLHYVGYAVDFRIYKDGNDSKRIDEIKRRLNIDFDVILESNHGHMEFQPRYRNL